MGMLDIASVYPEISNSAQQDKTSMSLMGWEGLQRLAQSSLNYMDQNVRGGLFQATGREGVLSPEMMMGRAISAYSKNPTAPGADQVLLEATRKFAPERLPQLLQSMENKRIKDLEETAWTEDQARRKAEEERAVAEEARRQELHDENMAQVGRLAEIREASRQNHLNRYQDPTQRQRYEMAGISEEFLRTAPPEAITEAIDLATQMDDREFREYQMERQMQMDAIQDADREQMKEMATATTGIFRDFVEETDSAYLQGSLDLMEQFPTAENYANFMTAFSRIEAERRETLQRALEASNKAGSEGYKPSEDEIDEAMADIIGTAEATGQLRKSGWLGGSKGFEISADMTREEQRAVDRIRSMARNVLELAAANGIPPNSEGAKQLAQAYISGAPEQQIYAIIRGAQPSVGMPGSGEAGGATPAGHVTDGTGEAVPLGAILDEGAPGLVELTGPRGFGRGGLNRAPAPQTTTRQVPVRGAGGRTRTVAEEVPRTGGRSTGGRSGRDQ